MEERNIDRINDILEKAKSQGSLESIAQSNADISQK